MIRGRTHNRARLFIGGLFVVAASAAVSFLLLKATYPTYLVEPVMVMNTQVQAGESIDLSWPDYGQAAVATEHGGVIATNGSQSPYPTASTAKIITVLAVLEEKPLGSGEQGPTLTMTEQDVMSYNEYVSQNGTNTPVYAGLKLTQYQAIQSILLRSSNNMSDTLATWAFGSLEAYHTFANEMVRRMGATHTTVAADASGLSAETTSTATDMARISLEALKHPVIAEIAAQSHADIPFAGQIQNSNFLLENQEITGLKTGETVEAGGNFLLSALHSHGGQSQQVVVVVYGAPLAITAMTDSYALYKSVIPRLTYEQIGTEGQVVARYGLPEGVTYEAVLSRSINTWLWAGESLHFEVDARPVTHQTQVCGTAGVVRYQQNSVPLQVRSVGYSC